MRFYHWLFLLCMAVVLGCNKVEDEEIALRSETFNYTFNNGAMGSGTAYNGTHDRSLSAQIKIEELQDGRTSFSAILNGTIPGAVYKVHIHDYQSPVAPSFLPYKTTPNISILATDVVGNGATAVSGGISTMGYDQFINAYKGILIVHDPAVFSVTSMSTFLVFGKIGMKY